MEIWLRKLTKYVMGKKSAAGDRPAVTKGGSLTPLAYPDMPFAVKPMRIEEYVMIYAGFRVLLIFLAPGSV